MPDRLLARQRKELDTFVATPQARAVAARHLHRSSASSTADDIDDLLAEARFRVHRRLTRGGPLTAERWRDGAVEAYVTTVIRHVAVSRWRAARRRPIVDLVEPDTLGMAEDASGPHPADLPAEVFDDVRAALHARVDHVHTWPTAAALALVTITEHPGLHFTGDVPRPNDDNEAAVAEWASLHYAGRHDCFADNDLPVIRQRRSRAIRQFRAELEGAARTAGIGPGTGT